jgi:SAM-dependent methyltransferase
MEDSFEFRGYHIPVRLCLLTGGGPETFESISNAHLHNINAACGLREGLHVLEIGCGIGRDAIPLTDVIGSRGRYIGTDVIADSIRWCTENISVRHPNFSFVHQDVRDDLHNPGGVVDVLESRLPAVDEWADLIVLQSVFTHMLRDTVSHYLHEFARVLRPNGLVYATVFLVDEETLKSARRTNLTEWNLRFEHSSGNGVYINDPKHPTGAVAYREDVLAEVVADAGLELVGPIRRGAWSGAHSLVVGGQDVLVLRRNGLR